MYVRTCRMAYHTVILWCFFTNPYPILCLFIVYCMKVPAIHHSSRARAAQCVLVHTYIHAYMHVRFTLSEDHSYTYIHAYIHACMYVSHLLITQATYILYSSLCLTVRHAANLLGISHYIICIDQSFTFIMHCVCELTAWSCALVNGLIHEAYTEPWCVQSVQTCMHEHGMCIV